MRDERGEMKRPERCLKNPFRDYLSVEKDDIK
jgi:hypothetical protein